MFSKSKVNCLSAVANGPHCAIILRSYFIYALKEFGEHMVKMFMLFLAMSLFTFQTLASTGTFIIVKNDIKIVKKGGATETAKVGSSVLVGDTVVSGSDSRAKIAMQDRNIITVLPNTKLTIEEYKTGEKNRNVKLSLLQGKV